MATFTVDAAYGYVVLTVCISWVMLNWLALRVAKARSQYGVKVPAMYNDSEPIFNCIQRGHQNTLETYPVFVAMLLLGGLQYPRLCAVSGFVWIISRIFYALGYSSGEPKNRNKGLPGYIGLLVLLGSTTSFGLHLLEWI